MKRNGLTTFLKSSAAVAFLAVAAPSDAPAQGFDMMNPNNIMNPVHPFNPITDPLNVWGTHGDGTAEPAPQAPAEKPEAKTPAQGDKQDKQNNANLALLIGLGAAFGFASVMALAVGDKPKPPAPRRTPGGPPRGGDF